MHLATSSSNRSLRSFPTRITGAVGTVPGNLCETLLVSKGAENTRPSPTRSINNVRTITES